MRKRVRRICEIKEGWAQRLRKKARKRVKMEAREGCKRRRGREKERKSWRSQMPVKLIGLEGWQVKGKSISIRTSMAERDGERSREESWNGDIGFELEVGKKEMGGGGGNEREKRRKKSGFFHVICREVWANQRFPIFWIEEQLLKSRESISIRHSSLLFQKTGKSKIRHRIDKNRGKKKVDKHF